MYLTNSSGHSTINHSPNTTCNAIARRCSRKLHKRTILIKTTLETIWAFFIHNQQLWASASKPTGSVPTIQSPEVKMGSITLWPPIWAFLQLVELLLNTKQKHKVQKVHTSLFEKKMCDWHTLIWYTDRSLHILKPQSQLWAFSEQDNNIPVTQSPERGGDCCAVASSQGMLSDYWKREGRVEFDGVEVSVMTWSTLDVSHIHPSLMCVRSSHMCINASCCKLTMIEDRWQVINSKVIPQDGEETLWNHTIHTQVF